MISAFLCLLFWNMKHQRESFIAHSHHYALVKKNIYSYFIISEVLYRILKCIESVTRCGTFFSVHYFQHDFVHLYTFTFLTVWIWLEIYISCDGFFFHILFLLFTYIIFPCNAFSPRVIVVLHWCIIHPTLFYYYIYIAFSQLRAICIPLYLHPPQNTHLTIIGKGENSIDKLKIWG